MVDMNLRRQNYSLRVRGFTLIELLAVIAIIGIITAMIVQLAPAVNQNKKRQRVQVEKEKLVLLINNYKAKFGHFPPDNPNVTNSAKYDTYTQLNPLLYELCGGTNNYQGGPQFRSFDGTIFAQTVIPGAFDISGIENADAELQVIYKPLPQPSAYAAFPRWLVPANGVGAQGLLVPVEMTQTNAPNPNAATPTNFWHYDASSTNRHNLDSFDLWAEFVVGKNKNGWVYVTNGNW
jgi:prepilin-type N-terminal cleavage/methylation domain-containing protein